MSAEPMSSLRRRLCKRKHGLLRRFAPRNAAVQLAARQDATSRVLVERKRSSSWPDMGWAKA